MRARAQILVTNDALWDMRHVHLGFVNLETPPRGQLWVEQQNTSGLHRQDVDSSKATSNIFQW